MDLKQYDINSVDVYGNTALHLCVMLRHVECASLLLVAGARVGVKNKEGWNALHEATSIGDRDLLRRLWSAYKARAAAAQELSGFLTHLHSVPDFTVTFKWKVESWLPFVGRWLPSDSITLSKRGARIRVDTNMLEFKNMAWVHHPYSFLLRPRHEHGEEAKGAAPFAAAGAGAAAASSAATAAAAASFAAPASAESVAAAQNPRQPFLVFTMDHELKKWQCVNTDEEKEAAEAERLWKQQHDAERKQQQKDDSAPSAAAASSSSSSSVAVAAAGPPVDVDLEYELDDWMSTPIASAFSPGRLQFKPVTARSWRSWSSWTSLVGVGTAPQRVESVAHWRASVWTVDHIRVHMLKRFEHLSRDEIQKVQNSSSHFRSIMSDPVKLRKALKEKEKEEEEEEEEGEEAADNNGGAEGQQKKKKKKKEEEEEKHVHRASLPPPPPCGVSFTQYFHCNNQRAYTVMDAEERFDAARDAAIDDAAHAHDHGDGPAPAHARMAVQEEAIDLPEEKDAEEEDGDEDEDDEEEEEGEDDGEDTSAVLDEEPDHGSGAAAGAAPLSPPAPAPAYTLASDSDAADAPYIHLGRPVLQQVTRKKYSARLWCADHFPLSMATVVHVVRLLFAKTYPQVVGKFEQFAMRELPPGFPVRITAPVLPCIAFDIAITAFAQGNDIRYGDDDDGNDPHAHARFFRIPPHYTREEESEEEQHKRQQRYRKRWAAAESKTRKDDSTVTANAAATAAAPKKNSISRSSSAR